MEYMLNFAWGGLVHGVEGLDEVHGVHGVHEEKISGFGDEYLKCLIGRQQQKSKKQMLK